MSNSFFIVRQWLKYRLHSRHSGGHGIHSPFVYHLLTKAIEAKTPLQIVKPIDTVRKSLKKNQTVVKVKELGAPSRIFTSDRRPVNQIAKFTATHPKYAQLLWRLVDYFKPGNVLELGASLGISGMYLCFHRHMPRLISVEGSESLASIARQNLNSIRPTGTNVIAGEISECLPIVFDLMPKIDFAYFDANHQYAPSIKYFEQCLCHFHKNSVLVVADIHLNPGMQQAWEEICQHREVVITIDLFELGLVFFNKACSKQDFVIRF